MTGYRTAPKADDDPIKGARWTRAVNPAAARRSLNAAFEAFDRLARFPESGPVVRLKHRRLAGVRFTVMPPPFNRWLIFYRLRGAEVEMLRVLYGTQDWRGSPASFFS